MPEFWGQMHLHAAGDRFDSRSGILGRSSILRPKQEDRADKEDDKEVVIFRGGRLGRSPRSHVPGCSRIPPLPAALSLPEIDSPKFLSQQAPCPQRPPAASHPVRWRTQERPGLRDVRIGGGQFYAQHKRSGSPFLLQGMPRPLRPPVRARRLLSFIPESPPRNPSATEYLSEVPVSNV